MRYSGIKKVALAVCFVWLLTTMVFTNEALGKAQPSIEDYATIEAYVGKDEIPVYAFGFTYDDQQPKTHRPAWHVYCHGKL